MVTSLRVLLADSDAVTRHALALLLKNKMGLHNVVEAVDGDSFAQALTEAHPKLVLLDWSLPGRPARAALLALCRAYPRMRLVILSVDAADVAEANALSTAFIHKGSPAAQVLEQLQALQEEL